MKYYEVAVNRLSVKGQQTLTYSSEVALNSGDVVRVPVGKSHLNGVVFKQSSKPSYQVKQVEAVLYEKAIPKQLINLAKWMSEYYATELPHVMQTILPTGLEKTRRELKTKDTSSARSLGGNLTKDQIMAMKTLKGNADQTIVLHGVTGSGKTRIYIERAKQVVDSGRGAIVLVPEIGLTSQIVADFRGVFADPFVIHSHLSESKRHQIWEAILKHPAPVVIGPRSALFSPIKNLGLVVIDEEHESSYKQDKSPKYHAVRVGSALAKLSQVQLVLGSATPSVEDRYLAEDRGAKIIRIKEPVSPEYRKSATVNVIDLKQRDNFSTRSKLISMPMINNIAKTLDNGRQILLFHNRRGTATSVVCTNCGWLGECPNCMIPLTFHHDQNRLICHVCGFKEPAPFSCPDCGEPKLLYKGTGTKQIVAEVKKLFPVANIARFDGDVKKGGTLEERYSELTAGKIDIIVGTQMIAKGLDLPKLDYVGVVLADTALYLPDYSANERAFQLLYQVIGRTGRHSHGTVDIQTYTADHPAIQSAINRSYEKFYKQEIEERQLTKYPPFRFLLSLTAERATQKTAISAAEKLAKEISGKYNQVDILGPSPAFHERTRSGWRWQLVIKSKSRTPLTEIAQNLPAKWQFELDPINLL